MAPQNPKEEENITYKYNQKLNTQLNTSTLSEINEKPIFSREYLEFKREYLPSHMDWYEKACNFAESLVKLSPSPKVAAQIEESIRIAHLNVTANGIYTLSLLTPMAFIIVGILVGFSLPILSGTEEGSLFFMAFSLFTGVLMYVGLNRLPDYYANSWRMKASNQMVLCVFYVVTYMRHTSNLELAIDFAGEHLGPPLALDLKKIMWDVETQKYDSLKESLDAYLETWKKWNMEFIEAFHLIESSLYEPSESRRIEMLDKSLDVILTETYEKMLHYARNLKSPITMINMIGVVLPILFLVILPLAINFVTDDNGIPMIKWYHIAVVYNFLLPVGVFLLGKSTLSNRPTGYGGTSSVEGSVKEDKLSEINFFGMRMVIDPVVISVAIAAVLFIIGISPIIMHVAGMTDFGIDLTKEDLSTPCQRQFCMLQYKTVDISGTDTEVGPFGLGATLISICITLAAGLSIGTYYSIKAKKVIEIREQTKTLEAEFASALFQLGNRIGDGLPAEIAFGKVATVMEGSISGNFFNIVSSNIRRLGMSVNEAIFNRRNGAIVYFPSNIIESSMKVLIQSVQKGPDVAAQALVNVSRYIKEIHAVNERLQDLMAEVIASLRSQISFLTPVISGIVIGITSMISSIMGRLAASQQKLSQTTGGGESLGGLGTLLSGVGIPTYYFQVIVGLYVTQIIYILTVLANDIENGEDKASEKYSLGVNMTRSVTMYCIIAATIILIFNIVASQIINVVGGA